LLNAAQSKRTVSPAEAENKADRNAAGTDDRLDKRDDVRHAGGIVFDPNLEIAFVSPHPSASASVAR
jgi:hypothetical protein